MTPQSAATSQSDVPATSGHETATPTTTVYFTGMGFEKYKWENPEEFMIELFRNFGNNDFTEIWYAFAEIYGYMLMVPEEEYPRPDKGIDVIALIRQLLYQASKNISRVTEEDATQTHHILP